MRWSMMALLLSQAAGTVVATMEDPARVLIVYVSRSGHTEALAGAIAEGVRSVEGVDGILRRAAGVEPDEILAASGLVVGTPVHWASASAEAHAFLERVGEALVGAGELGPESRPSSKLRAGGVFVTAGAVASGKELARLDVLAALLNMRFVVVGGEEPDGFGTLGPQATTGESDPGLDDAELAEARAFGQRFAELTLALVR